jgi:hypothetical protein
MKTILLFFILTTSVLAEEASFKIEPIYGLERTQKHFPKPSRYVTRSVFGVRGTYGYKLLSGEMEVNKAQDTEEFTEQDLKITDSAQRALFGVRSTFEMASFFDWFLRGGIRLTENKRETIQNGSVSNQTEAIQYDPYAGTGININLSHLFSLNAAATMVFTQSPTEATKGEYDVQYTFGFTVKGGSANSGF